jgi:head-tail adaptor
VAGVSEFAGTLRERIIIEQAATVRSAAALQVAGWEMVARCLARIEPEGVGAEAEGQALSAMARFRVTIRPVDGLAVGQRVTWKGRQMLVRQVVDDPRARDRVLLRCEEVRG